MGKKKDKQKERAKEKENLKDGDRPGRKELTRELERLQLENEALKARLERIAEISTAGISDTATSEPAMGVLAPPDGA